MHSGRQIIAGHYGPGGFGAAKANYHNAFSGVQDKIEKYHAKFTRVPVFASRHIDCNAYSDY
jgi:hypothetical protein